jgi:citrate lyase beta subunit
MPMRLRSLLFVPADRPERFARAAQSGADAICLDLEDAVAPQAKDVARKHALDFLDSNAADPARLTFRINEIRSQHGLRDVQSLIDAGRAPAALLLPKVRTAEDVRQVRELLADRLSAPRLIPLIETADGLTHAEAIAAAAVEVEALLFGGADLSAELGCALDWEPLLYARSRVVHAAATASVAAIDMPLLATNDGERLHQECARARALGFTGKAAIHPNQIAGIHAAFTPSPAEIGWAQRVLEAAAAAREGAIVLDGRMIDAAVVRAAHRTLARAAAAGES